MPNNNLHNSEISGFNQMFPLANPNLKTEAKILDVKGE